MCKLFACDFETEIDKIKNFKTPISPNLKQTYQKSDVVVNPICHIAFFDSQYLITQNFKEFLDHLVQIKNLRSTKKNPFRLIYHNLKYDFAIILEELLFYDFIQVVDKDDNKSYKGLPKHHILKKSTKSNYFEIIGKDIRNLRYVKIKYKHLYFELIDTYQIFTGSLKDFGKSFNVEVQKMEYNWKTHVNGTNHNYIKEYCKADCKSLYQCYLAIIAKIGQEGFTMSGMTMKNFRDHYLHDDFKKVFPSLQPWCRQISHYGYHGGVVYVNPIYKNKIVENVRTIDVNSMYPYVMKVFTYPYGEGALIEEQQIDVKLYQEMIVYIEYEMRTMFPFFRVHSSNKLNPLYNLPNENFTRTDTPKIFKGVISINSIDLSLIRKYAIIKEIIYHEIYQYKTDYFFTEFMKDKMAMKIQAKIEQDFGGEYSYKVQGNGLYGKFGQNLTDRQKIYTKKIQENGKNFFVYHQTDLEGVYTPVASAVTAYSRKVLLEGVERIGFEQIVYTDTDSLWFIDSDLTITKSLEDMIHSTDLGKWDIDRDEEGNVLSYVFKVLGLKTYYAESGKHKLVKCVGLSKSAANTFTLSTFVNGEKKRVQKGFLAKGGIHIREVEYELRRW